MTGQPVYLTESLHSYEPQRCLRSSSLNSLTVPYCRTKLYRRRFSCLELEQITCMTHNWLWLPACFQKV